MPATTAQHAPASSQFHQTPTNHHHGQQAPADFSRGLNFNSGGGTTTVESTAPARLVYFAFNKHSCI